MKTNSNHHLFINHCFICISFTHAFIYHLAHKISKYIYRIKKIKDEYYKQITKFMIAPTKIVKIE